jgi:integrase
MSAEERLIDAVARYFGSTDCRAIVHAQLVAAAIALRPQGKDSTRNRKVIAPAAAVLHYAADQKWCSYQRLPKFKESRKSNREPATEETLRLIMANVEKPRASKFGRKRDNNVAYKRLLLAMLYELGLRITDLLRIDWGAINLSTGRVVVRIAKTDETASLELSHVVVAMLANLPCKDGRLFPWSNRSGVYTWLKYARKQANVHYTPHLSRHALATAAGDAQIPDGEAAKLGVWRDPRSLHRYQHVRPDAIPGRNAGTLVEPAAVMKATG